MPLHQTPRDRLRTAALTGDARAVSLLLESEEGRRAARNRGNGVDCLTALMNAVRSLNKDCVAALIPHSDLKTVEKNGLTALMQAVLMGNAAAVELLLPFVDARLADPSGNTALMHAAACHQTACIRLLLPGSEPNALNCLGQTALMMAADEDNWEGVMALLPYSDATLTARSRIGRSTAENQEQWTAFDFALHCPYEGLSGKCVDALASTVSIEKLRSAVEKMGRERAPACAAIVEASELKLHMDLNAAQADATGAQKKRVSGSPVPKKGQAMGPNLSKSRSELHKRL